MTQPIRGYRVAVDEEHAYDPPTTGVMCRKCGGKFDHLGHVLARRRKAEKPLDDPRRKS